MVKYVVTGYVKSKRRREILTLKLDYDKAREVLASQKRMMLRAIPKHKWVSNLKIKKVT